LSITLTLAAPPEPFSEMTTLKREINYSEDGLFEKLIASLLINTFLAF
jgi:hypothetical protein